MAYDNFLIDKRVVERNIAKGLAIASSSAAHRGTPRSRGHLVHVSGRRRARRARLDVDDDLDDEEDDEEDDEGEDDDEEEQAAGEEPADRSDDGLT